MPAQRPLPPFESWAIKPAGAAPFADSAGVRGLGSSTRVRRPRFGRATSEESLAYARRACIWRRSLAGNVMSSAASSARSVRSDTIFVIGVARPVPSHPKPPEGGVRFRRERGAAHGKLASRCGTCDFPPWHSLSISNHRIRLCGRHPARYLHRRASAASPRPAPGARRCSRRRSRYRRGDARASAG